MFTFLNYSGDNHGGHYVVYINPKGDGKVTILKFLFYEEKNIILCSSLILERYRFQRNKSVDSCLVYIIHF